MEADDPAAIAALQAAGLDEAQMERLSDLRQRIARGERSELTLDEKYRQFLQYLLASHRLDEEQTS